MCRTQCVLSLLLLYAGLVHSFSWDIVTYMNRGLEFYDVNGTLTHTENIPPGIFVTALTYDPVHQRVLFADLNKILSFDIASQTIIMEPLVKNTTNVNTLTYDPASELLVWNENFRNIYSMSLKHGLNRRVKVKQLILSGAVYDITVDICGGFIYWLSEHWNVERVRFDGSQRETIVGRFTSNFVNIDQYTQKVYWYESGFNDDYVKCADFNGENIHEIRVVESSILESKQLTFSKDHIYWKICDFLINCSIWQIPKNAPSNVDSLDESNLLISTNSYIMGMAVKYNIEDVTRRVQNCGRLKSLLPNNSVSNVSSDVSQLCVHGTKVSGESRCECAQGYSGEKCDVSV